MTVANTLAYNGNEFITAVKKLSYGPMKVYAINNAEIIYGDKHTSLLRYGIFYGSKKI